MSARLRLTTRGQYPRTPVTNLRPRRLGMPQPSKITTAAVCRPPYLTARAGSVIAIGAFNDGNVVHLHQQPSGDAHRYQRPYVAPRTRTASVDDNNPNTLRAELISPNANSGGTNSTHHTTNVDVEHCALQQHLPAARPERGRKDGYRTRRQDATVLRSTSNGAMMTEHFEEMRGPGRRWRRN